MASPQACMTTSWDDGHPLDLRVADLLARHGLRGTFYVPRMSERGTMTPSQMRELSGAFEIGAHTVGHVVLTGVADDRARAEIVDGKTWLEESTGTGCGLFCPPGGHYAERHLRMIRDAGYLGLRNTELTSLDYPRRHDGLLVMPTTVQAYPHGRGLDFVRNGLKRAAFGNLWRLLVHGRSAEWSVLAQALLRRVLAQGGVFHLWGHSWELTEPAHWERLDAVLRTMSEASRSIPSFTNGQVCWRAMPADVGRRAAPVARTGRSPLGSTPP